MKFFWFLFYKKKEKIAVALSTNTKKKFPLHTPPPKSKPPAESK